MCMKVLSLLLSFAIAISLILPIRPLIVMADSPSDTFQVYKGDETTYIGAYPDLSSALSAADDGYVIKMTCDYEESNTVNITKSITLTSSLETHIFKRKNGNENTLFIIATNKTLTLKNIIIDGSKENLPPLVIPPPAGSPPQAFTGPLIYVQINSNLIMNSVTCLQNNRGEYGGAVYNEGNFTINDGIIKQNESTIDGGAICNHGNLTINYCNITNNSGKDGGGVFSDGTFTLNGGIIQENNTWVNGGGVYNNNGGTFNMKDGYLFNNETAYNGGGLYNNGTVIIDGGNITANKENNWYGSGAGICNSPSGIITMNNGSIEGNQAICDIGGGMNNKGHFTMNNGTITNNSSNSDGGGVFNYEGGVFTMKNGIINKNISAVDGGGVYNNRGTFNMEGGSITENSVPTGKHGGGVYNVGYEYIDGSTDIVYNAVFNIKQAASIANNSVDQLYNDDYTIVNQEISETIGSNSTMTGNIENQVVNIAEAGNVHISDLTINPVASLGDISTNIAEPYVTWSYKPRLPMAHDASDNFTINAGYGSKRKVTLSANVSIITTPSAITGLAAIPQDGKVKLTWNSVAGATSYKIYRRTATGSYGDTSPIIVSAPTVTAEVSSLINGTNYYFIVKANNISDDGPPSDEVNATPQVSAPNAITDLSIAAGDGKVTLNWSAITGATSYKIYKRTEAGSYGSEIKTVTAPATNTEIDSLTNGSKYYFVVKASNAGGDSVNSNEVSATPQVNVANAISDLSIEAGDGKVTLNWSAITGATSYKIYKRAEAGSYGSEIKTVTTPATSTEIDSLANGSKYYFVVKARNAGGDSINSNEVSATPQVNVPDAISDLSIAAGDGKVTLNWSVVTGATSYKIYKRTEAGSYTSEIKIVTATTTSAAIDNLTNETKYYFVVKASNAGGDSVNSNEVGATPIAAVIIPTTPSAIAINDLTASAGDKQVTLHFSAASGATSIIVQQSMDGANYMTATTSSAITSSSTSATVTGLTNEVTYNFRLMVSGGAHAGISNVISATPAAPSPTIPETTAPSEDRIIVTNNPTGIKDTIIVTELNAGDVVKIYDSLIGGSFIASGMVLPGQTVANINVDQLGINAGYIYVSMTSTGKTESLRTAKAYAAELRNSNINPMVVNFDKNILKQADININIDLNGNILDNIRNNTYRLINGEDYIITGSIVTIKKKYLSYQSLGTTTLCFDFSKGSDKNLSIMIIDTTTNTVEDDDDKNIPAEASSQNIVIGNGTNVNPDKKEAAEVIAGIDKGNGISTLKLDILPTKENGMNKEIIRLDEDKATEIIKKAIENKEDITTILLSNLNNSKADKIEVQVPKSSTDKLIENNIGLRIDMQKVKFEFFKEDLKNLSGDLYVDVVGITGKRKITDNKGIIVKLLSGDEMMGNPIEIETNYTKKAKLTIGLDELSLPKDKVELEKELKNLSVMIEYSNGDKITSKGEIQYDDKGNAIAIQVLLNNFNKLAENNAPINVSERPEVKFVGLEHSPLVEGEKEQFIVSSSFKGEVQYRIYLQINGSWQEVTDGYTEPVSGAETFAITPDYKFEKGVYQGRVYVKKAGTKGQNEEEGIDYDDYYTYNINCVDRDDENRVYTIGKLNTSSENIKLGEKITITGVDSISGIPGPYFYRLHIYDVAKNEWTNNVVSYSEKIEWTPRAAGTYLLDVHIITPNSILWDKVEKDPTLIYGGYEGWKLKTIKVSDK